MKPLALPVLVVLALAVAAPGPLQAEESAGPTYDSLRAKLPWPAADKAISFRGQILVNAASMGAVVLEATPRTDTPGWHTQFDMTMMGGSMTWHGESLFDAKFTPVSGSLKMTTAGGAESKTWKAQSQGVQITTEGATEPKVVERSGSFVTSVTSLFLFCRLSNFAAGTVKTAIFDPDDEKFIDAEWTCGQVGMWNAKKARLVTGKRADGRTLEAGFDATSGELLGCKLGDATKSIEFRSGEAPKAPGLFDRPAKTAEEGAVQAMVAFATADLEGVMKSIHWPSIHEPRKAEPDVPDDLETFKTEMMALLKPELTSYGPREQMEPFFASLIPTLKGKQQEDGSTVVQFPSQVGNMRMTLRALDGTWLLVKMPSQPRRPSTGPEKK